jgi:hypothetical protein
MKVIKRVEPETNANGQGHHKIIDNEQPEKSSRRNFTGNMCDLGKEKHTSDF